MSNCHKIGEVQSGSGARWYWVFWNEVNRRVYCDTLEVGQAGTAREAMHAAAAWATEH